MGNKHKRFEHLVVGFSADIYRIAYWLCHDQSVAEDITQETFLRAWRSLDSLEDESRVKAWLITILRRENARRFERKQLELVDIDEVDPVVHESHWPDAIFAKDELYAAIGQLPLTYREPLVLQQLGGFSCEEIATMMNIGKGAVMTRLFRAKQYLKESMTEDNQVQKNVTNIRDYKNG